MSWYQKLWQYKYIYSLHLPVTFIQINGNVSHTINYLQKTVWFPQYFKTNLLNARKAFLYEGEVLCDCNYNKDFCVRHDATLPADKTENVTKTPVFVLLVLQMEYTEYFG